MHLDVVHNLIEYGCVHCLDPSGLFVRRAWEATRDFIDEYHEVIVAGVVITAAAVLTVATKGVAAPLLYQGAKKVQDKLGGLIQQAKTTGGGLIQDIPRAQQATQKAISNARNTLNLTSHIRNINGNYHAPKHIVNQIGQLEARGVNFSRLQSIVTQSRPSTEGGISRVIRYSDSHGVRFVIHEVTNRAGQILHRDFDSVRIASGQLINTPR